MICIEKNFRHWHISPRHHFQRKLQWGRKEDSKKQQVSEKWRTWQGGGILLSCFSQALSHNSCEDDGGGGNAWRHFIAAKSHWQRVQQSGKAPVRMNNCRIGQLQPRDANFTPDAKHWPCHGSYWRTAERTKLREIMHPFRRLSIHFFLLLCKDQEWQNLFIFRENKTSLIVVC